MLINTSEYLETIEQIKAAQYKAAVSVNQEMSFLYHSIGKVINLYIVSAQIPWSYSIAILDQVKDSDQQIWCIKKTAENGWSHNALIHQIESVLYQRQTIAEKISNLESHLPSPQSELALKMMKDPLELGTGFAFLGNQYHINVGGDDFYIDLQFYNLNLRCYVVIELETGDFKPEYAGQLNFHLSAVHGILKNGQDHPSIGLLLCKNKDDLVAEYSLKDMSKPIGMSEYRITSSLPTELERQLPSIENIQKHIQR